MAGRLPPQWGQLRMTAFSFFGDVFECLLWVDSASPRAPCGRLELTSGGPCARALSYPQQQLYLRNYIWQIFARMLTPSPPDSPN